MEIRKIVQSFEINKVQKFQAIHIVHACILRKELPIIVSTKQDAIAKKKNFYFFKVLSFIFIKNGT